jgi:methionyl-tRNA formyltransferase
LAAGAGKPGEVLAAGETLAIACGESAVEIADVQPAGKARMTAQAFVNGRRIAVGDVLA